MRSYSSLNTSLTILCGAARRRPTRYCTEKIIPPSTPSAKTMCGCVAAKKPANAPWLAGGGVTWPNGYSHTLYSQVPGWAAVAQFMTIHSEQFGNPRSHALRFGGIQRVRSQPRRAQVHSRSSRLASRQGNASSAQGSHQQLKARIKARQRIISPCSRKLTTSWRISQRTSRKS